MGMNIVNFIDNDKQNKKNGVDSIKTVDELEDDYADVIISSSVLEHVENPLGELRRLKRILKPGGKIVFQVPNESSYTEYVRSDVNNHLYTWNCLTLGNLFKAAGFYVLSVERIQEVWPREWEKLGKEISMEEFMTFCEIGGKAFDENRCVIVATKDE